jgi:integrase
MNTGCRKGEALAFKWGHVDFELGQIVTQGETSKSGTTRRVPISKKLMVYLIEWHDYNYEEELKPEDESSIVTDPDDLSEFVPPNSDDKVFPVKYIQKPWARLRKLAMLDEMFVPHLLRHHFASTLVKLGSPLPQVQELLSHKDITTTQIYLSVRDENLAEAVDLL